MNERERGICSRVKELRKRLKWSQPDFAALVGITLNQLASIEYGRTPLRYDIAWKLYAMLGISLEWLSINEFSAESFFIDDLPSPSVTGLPDSALLSEVSDKVHGKADVGISQKKPHPKYKLDEKELRHRAYIYLVLRLQLEGWIAAIPDGYTLDFSDKLIQLGNKYINVLPKDPAELVAVREDALMWERLRTATASKLALEKKDPKNDLTDVTAFDNNDGVKAKLPTLLKHLNEATRERGTKTALAKFMGVPLPKISQWLSGTHEPGGETTLKLLHWVEQQERQK